MRYAVILVVGLMMAGCASTRERIDGLSEYYEEKKGMLDKLNPFKPDNPAPEPFTEDLPFAWTQVEKCGGDRLVGDWPVTLKIHTFVIGRNVTWNYDAESLARVKSWKGTGRISKDPNAVIGGIVEWEPGRFCQWVGEWLPPGYQLQTRKIFECCRTHGGKTKHFFSGPMKHATIDDFKGKRVWLFTSGLNWKGQANVQERSNMFGPMVMD
jgi:hypothetical protein